MRTFVKVAAVSFLLILASCVPSLHPLYTENDVIFTDALLGVWAEPNEDETWEFVKENEKTYRLKLADDRKTDEFVAHLVKVEDKLFLDLFPANHPYDSQSFYGMHFIPAHSFLFVAQIEPALQLSALSPEWIKKFVEENPASIKHERVDDEILLTASPKELQKFLLKHLETKNAFSDLSNLERKKI